MGDDRRHLELEDDGAGCEVLVVLTFKTLEEREGPFCMGWILKTYRNEMTGIWIRCAGSMLADMDKGAIVLWAQQVVCSWYWAWIEPCYVLSEKEFVLYYFFSKDSTALQSQTTVGLHTADEISTGRERWSRWRARDGDGKIQGWGRMVGNNWEGFYSSSRGRLWDIIQMDSSFYRHRHCLPSTTTTVAWCCQFP